MLTDSRGIKTLVRMLDTAPNIPIAVHTVLDEAVAVKALELGAIAYLHKTEVDTNLLVYAIRSAIERQQQQTKQQLLEFEQLEAIAVSDKDKNANLWQSESLRSSKPDIFTELVQSYGEIMDLALNKKAYKVEHNISDKLTYLARQLGFLQATPRDAIAIHTTDLKAKTDRSYGKSQAYAMEGRLIVLELMGYLTTYYRKYFIGLNKLNFDKIGQDLESD